MSQGKQTRKGRAVLDSPMVQRDLFSRNNPAFAADSEGRQPHDMNAAACSRFGPASLPDDAPGPGPDFGRRSGSGPGFGSDPDTPTRTPETVTRTKDITLGTVRALFERGYVCLLEVPLANQRRADILGLHGSGDIVLVEVKSSLADFRADRKWPEYLAYCDRFYFAVAPDFPRERLVSASKSEIGAGVIVADQYGGDLMIEALRRPMSGGRRGPLMRRLARLGAQRLTRNLLARSLPA